LPSIRNAEETYKELIKLKGEITAKEKRNITIEEVLKRLIKLWEEELG